MTTKKEKFFINFVLAVFIAGIICCFTLFPLLSETVSAEELTNTSVLNFNQMFDYSKLSSSKVTDSYYVTISVNAGGYYSLDQKISFVAGHKYLIVGAVPGIGGLHFDSTASHPSFRVVDPYSFITAQFSDSYPFFVYGFSTGNFKSIIQIFDLTLCFGSGNEPSTVSEFKSYFNSEYYSYTLSTLVPLDATTSYSQGYTDGIQSFSVVTAADDIYNSSYYAKNSISDILSVNDAAPYFIKLVPSTENDDHLIFPMTSTIPANSNFTISGYISSYVHDYSGTLNIYCFVNNKDYIKLGSIKFNNSTMSSFFINFNLPFSVSNIAFDSTGFSLLGDVTVTYKISNLQKLAQDNYDAGRSSRDSDVTIAFENGKKVGMSQANPYTFNALFGAVFDAPIQALTGLLDI